MILGVWLSLTALAIDINDHLSVELEGDERVEGWYLRPEQSGFVMTVPKTGATASIPMSIVRTVTVNDRPQPLSAFAREVAEDWSTHEAWRADPPPHPLPGLMVGTGLVVAGSGHALMGEWQEAVPMMVVDTLCMGIVGAEIAGSGLGRADVFVTAAALSAIFKAYAASDGYRIARRRRARLGLTKPR